MSTQLRKINVQWKMESVDDPFFKYEDDGLEISFMIFMGDEERVIDIQTYMNKHEIAIPDSIWNHAGYAMIYYKFNGFDEFYCTSTSYYLKKVGNADTITSGIYEEVNNNEINGFVIVGHDMALSIHTKKMPSVSINKLC